MRITGKFEKFKFLISYFRTPNLNKFDAIFQDSHEFVIKENHGREEYESHVPGMKPNGKFGIVRSCRFTLMTESEFKATIQVEFLANYKRVDIAKDKNSLKKNVYGGYKR